MELEDAQNLVESAVPSWEKSFRETSLPTLTTSQLAVSTARSFQLLSPGDSKRATESNLPIGRQKSSSVGDTPSKRDWQSSLQRGTFHLAVLHPNKKTSSSRTSPTLWMARS